MVHLGEVGPQLWDDIVEEMEEALKDMDFQADDIMVDWKIIANKRKFDRELIEKYGAFKDIILHPKFQLAKQFVEENVDFNPLVADPIMPAATAVIVLFMLYKRVSLGILLLFAAYIFSVNPFYVSVASVAVWWYLNSSKPRKFVHVSTRTRPVPGDAASYVPQVWGASKASASVSASVSAPPKTDSNFGKRQQGNDSSFVYDHVLIGSDIGTLYTAALLSRNGHRVCVLQPKDAPVYEISPEGAPCSTPIVNFAVGRIERYQGLLDVAQPLSKRVRVTFSPCGTEADGYTSTLVNVKPTYTRERKQPVILSNSTQKDGKRRLKRVKSGGEGLAAMIALRVGQQSLAADLALRLPVEKSAVQGFLSSIVAPLSQFTTFLLSRIATRSEWEGNALSKSEPVKAFEQLASSTVEQVLGVSGLESEDAHHALAAVAAMGGAAGGALEALHSSQLSALYLAQAIHSAGNGIFYPRGGPSRLIESLSRTIRSYGGAVYTGVHVQGLVFQDAKNTTTSNTSSNTTSNTAPQNKLRAIGVSVSPFSDSISSSGNADSATAKSAEKEGESHGGNDFSSDEQEEMESTVFYGSQSITSGLGVLNTYTKLLPPDVLSLATQEILSSLTEARPKIRAVFWLRGTAKDMDLSSTDYVEIPTQDVPLSTNHAISQLRARTSGPAASTGEDGEKAASPTRSAPADGSLLSARQIGEELARFRETFAGRVLHIWSPSAKDPDWADRHPEDVQVLVVELEAVEPIISTKRFNFASETTENGPLGQPLSSGPTVYFSEKPEDSGSDPSNLPQYTENLGTPLTLSRSRQEKILQFAWKKVLDLYPLVQGKEIFQCVAAPTLGGHALSATPERFKAKISSRTDVENFFLTGSDLAIGGLAGQIQGGWVAANAILGYTLSDLTNNRNIVSDLRKVDSSRRKI